MSATNHQNDLWDAFLQKLATEKRAKISMLIDGLPLHMKKKLIANLLGLPYEEEALESSPVVSRSDFDQDDEFSEQDEPIENTSEEAFGASSVFADPQVAGSQEDESHALIKDENHQGLLYPPAKLTETREALVDPIGQEVIMWQVLSLARPFCYQQVGRRKHSAEIHTTSVETMWNWCWQHEFSDDLVNLMVPLALEPDSMSKAREAFLLNQIETKLPLQLIEFCQKLRDDDGLYRRVTFGEKADRLIGDLEDLSVITSSRNHVQRLEKQFPVKIPALKTRQIQRTIVAMRQFEALPSSVFDFLCAILSTRLSRPYELLKMITFLKSEGISVARSPYAICIEIVVAAMDRSFALFQHHQKIDSDAEKLAQLIGRFASYSRELRISVDIASFPSHEEQVITLRRDFSLSIEKIISSVMELTRRILRTISWLRSKPQSWGPDDLDEKEAYLAVSTLYAADKFISEFSLAGILTSAKKDLEQYLEVTIKGLLLEEDKLTIEDLPLYRSLVRRALHLAAYSFEEEYMNHLQSSFNRIMDHSRY